jgi:hypothetical protein
MQNLGPALKLVVTLSARRIHLQRPAPLRRENTQHGAMRRLR